MQRSYQKMTYLKEDTTQSQTPFLIGWHTFGNHLIEVQTKDNGDEDCDKCTEN